MMQTMTVAAQIPTRIALGHLIAFMADEAFTQLLLLGLTSKPNCADRRGGSERGDGMAG